MNLSPLYFTVAKPLMSIRTTGSMDVERLAKPLKDVILTKKRNRLSDERTVSLLRAQQNLKYLMSAQEVLKGKVCDSVTSRDPMHCVNLLNKHHNLLARFNLAEHQLGTDLTVHKVSIRI